MTIPWNNNHTQFARLLSEIRAMGLTAEQYETLKVEMDLDYEDIDEVLDRAQLEWERTKGGQNVRRSTPHREFMEFVDGSAV